MTPSEARRREFEDACGTLTDAAQYVWRLAVDRAVEALHGLDADHDAAEGIQALVSAGVLQLSADAAAYLDGDSDLLTEDDWDRIADTVKDDGTAFIAAFGECLLYRTAWSRLYSPQTPTRQDERD